MQEQSAGLYEQHCGDHVRIGRIHSDYGLEYVSLGKQHPDTVKTFSPPYTPELNGIAERINRTIVEPARSMLCQADLPECFWPYAVRQAVFVRNRVRHSTINASPYFLITGKKPSLKHLRVFGCAAYVLRLPQTGGKFAPRADEGTLLGSDEHGIYTVLVEGESEAPRIMKSRHVTFDEDRFLGSELSMDDGDSESSWQASDDEVSDGEFTDVEPSRDNEEDIQEDEPDVEDGNEDGEYHTVENTVTPGGDEGPEENNVDELPTDTPSNDHPPPQETHPQPPSHRYPRRDRRPPQPWWTLTTSTSASNSQLQITTSDEPTLREALHSTPVERDLWLQAIEEETKALNHMGTWEPADHAEHAPLPTHVVLKVKRNADGTIERFKSRIVAGGNHQVYGYDYMETYAPVVDFSVVRLFLYMMLVYNLVAVQLDVKTAFLNGELEEAVWVMSPKGIPGHPSRLYRLRKALYGLKQAHLAWHRKLCSVLSEMNFSELKSAPCVFVKRLGDAVCYVLVYVDDLLLMSSSQSMLDKVVQNMCGRFETRVMEKLELFLGVELEWSGSVSSRTGVRLSQKRYVMDILRRFGMTEAKPVSTPMVERFFETLDAEENKEVVQVELFQSIIGSLMYLALRTRPDILVAVVILARFSQSPTAYCHRAAKRILRYLRGSVNTGMVYRKGSMQFETFVDSDYAADTQTRKSTSGWIVKFGEAAVSWNSKRQNAVALSTCEAEYHALTEASKDILYFHTILEELGINLEGKCPKLRSDNMSAINWATGEKAPKKRAKHIHTKVHFVRDLVADQQIDISYVPSEENTADVLTKPLGSIKHEVMEGKLILYAVVEEEC